MKIYYLSFPIYIRFQLFVVPTIYRMTFSKRPCYNRSGGNDCIVRNMHTFQNGTSATYPNMISYTYGSRYIDNLMSHIANFVKIGIHYQDFP